MSGEESEGEGGGGEEGSLAAQQLQLEAEKEALLHNTELMLGVRPPVCHFLHNCGIIDGSVLSPLCISTAVGRAGKRAFGGRGTAESGPPEEGAEEERCSRS